MANPLKYQLGRTGTRVAFFPKIDAFSSLASLLTAESAQATVGNAFPRWKSRRSIVVERDKKARRLTERK